MKHNKSRVYQRVQIPVRATTSDSTPTYRCAKTNCQWPQMPGLARTANGGDATVAVIAAAATHAPHIPGAMRIAVRDAGGQQPRSPTHTAAHPTGRQTTVTWTACSRESDGMREVQPAQRSQQSLGGTDYTRTAAVRNCRVCFPCASPASSSCWAGLISSCISNFEVATDAG